MIKILHNDAPYNWNISFQDNGSLLGEGIIRLHDKIMIYLLIILIVVVWITTVTIIRFKKNKIIEKYSNHSTILEIIWTIIPTMIIIGILGPSFSLLYLMDEIIEPVITIKYVGHQWYWTIEYTNKEIESYMIGDSELEEGKLRLLEVDNRVILPYKTEIRIIVTSGDVIHSLGIPSLGIKMDGIPGRLNQTSLYILRKGVFYGGCYELCGAMHARMPTVIESVNIEDYLIYINNI